MGKAGWVGQVRVGVVWHGLAGKAGFGGDGWGMFWFGRRVVVGPGKFWFVVAGMASHGWLVQAS